VQSHLLGPKKTVILWSQMLESAAKIPNVILLANIF
jgi:hypothetical protein